MSQAALCLAVKARLQSVLTWDDNTCDVMFDGQPKPMAGELFVAVWPGSWTTNDIEGLDEYFGVNVTVTRKFGYSPKDRGGTELWTKAVMGMEALLNRIKVALHHDVGGDAIMAAANAIINATSTHNGFIEPLRFRNGGRPELKGPDWFEATPEGEGWSIAGVAQTMMFDRARRVQTIESMG